MHQIVASLTDNSRGIIYEHNIFIIQATDYDTMLKLYNSKISLISSSNFITEDHTTCWQDLLQSFLKLT
jgi:hypothetical protein